MTILRACLAGLATWLSFSPVAQACSTPDSYVPPSGFELVEMADAIVVATAIDGSMAEVDGKAHVHFRVQTVLKGDPPKEFDNEGYVLVDPKDKERNDFESSCGRSGFTQGRRYVVALLKTPEGDGWTEANYLFARSSEDYAGPNDPWVKMIRDFVDIQKRFASREQYEELKRLAERLRKQRKTDAVQAEIDTIEQHLGIRSEFKPTWYLVETYEQLERGEALRWPWMPREYWDPDKAPPPVEEQKNSVLGFLVQREHPEAAPFFERQLAKAKPSASELGSAILFVAQSGDRRRAFDIVSARVAPMLAVHSPRDAMILMGLSRQAMNGDGRFWGREAWKDDPYIAQRWPIMAFGFGRYAELLLGGGSGSMFDAELDALKPANFRDWPEWTLAKARHNDEVQAWAAEELKDNKLIADYATTLSSWDSDSFSPPPEDPARLPMQAMLRSYSGPRAEILEQAFCQGAVRRRLLINLLGAEADAIYDSRLFKRMLATPSLTEEERMRITLSLSELIGAIHKRARLAGYLDGHEFTTWRDLLAVALSGERPNVKPIECAAR